MNQIGWQEITGVVTLAGFIIWIMSKFVMKIYNDQRSLSFSMAEMLKHNAKMNEEIIRAMQGITESINSHSQKIDKMDSTIDVFSKILMEVITNKK